MTANSIEAEIIVFNILKQIMKDANKPDGGIYFGLRPVNSCLEDLVINTLALDRHPGMQKGVVVVNVHVPNLSACINGINDHSIPNRSRINYLSRLVEKAIENDYGDYGNCRVQQDNMEYEEKSSYNSIRIDFSFSNI